MDGRTTLDALVRYCSVYKNIQEVKDDFLARIKPYTESASKVTGTSATIKNEKLKILNKCFTDVLGWGFGNNQVPNQAYYATHDAMTILDGTAGGSKKTLLDMLPVKSVTIMDDATFQSRCLVKSLTHYDVYGKDKYTADGFHIRKYNSSGKMIKDYNMDFLIWAGNAKAAGKGDEKKETDFNVRTYAGLHADGKMMVRMFATYLPYMIDNINEISGGELAIPPIFTHYEKQKDSTGKVVTLKDSKGNDLPKRRALIWSAKPGNHSVGRAYYYPSTGLCYACTFHIAPIAADRWTHKASGLDLYDIKNWGKSTASTYIRMCVRTSGTGASEKILDTNEVDYFCRSGRNYNTGTKLTSITHELTHVLQNFWRNGPHTATYMWDTEGGADLVNGGSKTLIQNNFGYELLYGKLIKNASVYELKNGKLVKEGEDPDTGDPVYKRIKQNITIDFNYVLRTDTSSDEYKAASSYEDIGDYRYRAGCCLKMFLYRSVVMGWDQKWREEHHDIKADKATIIK